MDSIIRLVSFFESLQWPTFAGWEKTHLRSSSVLGQKGFGRLFKTVENQGEWRGVVSLTQEFRYQEEVMGTPAQEIG